MKTWCKGALYIMNKLVVLIFLSVFSVSACSNEQCARSLEVTATAYTSSPDETNDEPTIAAWGDELKPGMNVIAVSRDLIDLRYSSTAAPSSPAQNDETLSQSSRPSVATASTLTPRTATGA